ncbi:MAG: FtsQ-type POTRA domain-containing protein [Bdellovibrionota bacterium]
MKRHSVARYRAALLRSTFAMASVVSLALALAPTVSADVVPHTSEQAEHRDAREMLASRAALRSEVVPAVPIAFSSHPAGEVPADNVSVASSGSAAPQPSGGFVELYNAQREFVGSVTRNLLQFSKIEVRGNYRLHADQIIRAAGLDSTPWLWDVTEDRVRNKLLHSPWVESADLRVRPFPAALELRVTEAEPWMIAEYEKHSWLVSRKGILLQTLDTLRDPELILETTELPRLDGLDPQPMVESYLSSANARFGYATKLIRLLQSAGELPFAVERFTLLQNGSIKLVPQQRTETQEVLLAAQSFDDASSSLDRLRRVLEDLRKRGEHVRRIDLRFKNQAIIE